MLSDEEIREQHPTFRGNIKHLRILLEGVESWNAWRLENPDEEPDLRRAHFKHAHLKEANLGGANLKGAHLERADLREAHLEQADLEGAHLEHANLNGAHLERAILVRAHLEQADLVRAHLEQADLERAHLEQADLVRAHLEEADLEGAYLENAHLNGAHLERAKLNGAHLERADLSFAHLENADLSFAYLENADLKGAHLENADLKGAHLENADLKRAHLEHAKLRGAHLKGSNWNQADLSGADLRVRPTRILRLNDTQILHSRHLRLDDTKILHSRFEPGSEDPWSVVRRTYAGPALLFHLIFLLIFLVPYLSRAAYWKGVNTAQETAATIQAAADRHLEQSSEVLEDQADDPSTREELEALRAEGLAVDRVREVLERGARRQRERTRALATVYTLQPTERLGLCLKPAKKCGSKQPIWRPMLGLHQHDSPIILRLLAIVLIAYNVLRGILTFYVSRLREAEIRSGYSPPLKGRQGYIWVYNVHTYFLQYVPVAGLTAAAIQIAEWLLVTDVVLPAG